MIRKLPFVSSGGERYYFVSGCLCLEKDYDNLVSVTVNEMSDFVSILNKLENDRNNLLISLLELREI